MLRFLCILAFVAGLLVLTGCDKQANEPVRVSITASTMTTTTIRATTTTTVAHKIAGTPHRTAAVGARGSNPRAVGSRHSPTNGGVPASLASVMACIRAHESGNYTEHSHIWDGSGAYQMIPSTWRTWSSRAGYPGWSYEYEAPSGVQDAVVAYTLTHGGAHNWSPRYGNDPCTVSLP